MKAFAESIGPVYLLKLLAICAAAVITAVGCVSSPAKSNGGIKIYAKENLPLLTEDAGLNQMIEYVRLHHPDVRAAEERFRGARARVIPAGTLPDPALTFSQNLRDKNNQMAGIAQGIPMWGKRGLAASMAEYRALAAEAGLDQARLNAVLVVKKAYAEHAYIYDAYTISLEQYNLINHLVQVVRIAYQTGQTSMAGLLRIQAESDRQRSELAGLENLKKASAARLNAALGRRPDAPLADPSPLSSMGIEDFNPAIPENLDSTNPELAAMLHELAALEKQKLLSSRSGYPDLMIGIEAERRKSMGENEYMFNAMAGINIPVWRGSYSAQREEASADHKAMEISIEQRHNEIRADMDMLIYRLNEARRNVELYGRVLTVRAGQALASIEASYRSGEAGFSELIDTQRELLAYRMAHIRAVADSIIFLAELETLTGRIMEAANEK